MNTMPSGRKSPGTGVSPVRRTSLSMQLNPTSSASNVSTRSFEAVSLQKIVHGELFVLVGFLVAVSEDE